MLELKNIVKDYYTGNLVTHALKGVSINFRRNEFVSILGPSGCGKTTLLNIIGGLDRYTSGDLIIEGKSTKEYKDRDWDTYRNHSIGFVFQSYNLIMHQSILGNVELALTISGVSKKDRRERAKKALEQVGLGEYVTKMPNQLSGGQMQRVAIARALVNNPEILLADEPTGALDSETSVQIMDLLKEIASDRLVIMVTHNPDLAKAYSTRIINLSDGLVIGDSNPFTDEDAKKDIKEIDKSSKGRKRQASMSFLTALGLSFKNLLSKKGRTILISFAGSIGITGIALILSLSDGFHNYINQIQTDTLSSYPITISETENQLSIDSLISNHAEGLDEYPEGEDVKEAPTLTEVVSSYVSTSYTNDLKSFKVYLEKEETKKEYEKYYNAIQYVYDVDFRTFSKVEGTYEQVYPVSYSSLGPLKNYSWLLQNYDEIIDNRELIEQQYDILKGDYPTKATDLVIILDKYNRIDDYVLYALGLKNIDEDIAAITAGEKPKKWSGNFDQLLSLTYKQVLRVDLYKDRGDGLYVSRDSNEFNEYIDEVCPTLNVVGILRPKQSSTTQSINGSIGYTSKLTELIVNRTNESPYIVAQKADPTHDLRNDKQEITSLEYDKIMNDMGVCDFSAPSRIKIYPKSFEAKDKVKEMITIYNDAQESETKTIKYTDSVSVIIEAVSIIVNSVTYVLIAFVSISLVVSSIMIGIITYVSVIERTKEIGVLRSLGASKKDVGNVFNAETLMIGFSAGLVGIGITLLLIIPINIILFSLTKIASLAVLMWYWILALIGISMILTLIAGLFPSMIAANKDPVVALRTGE